MSRGSTASGLAAAVAVVVALAFACLAAPGFAQDANAGRTREMAAELKKRFDAADRDHDGRLTRDEAKAGMPRVYEHFDTIDTARAGSIALADIVAWARQQRRQRGAQGS